MNKEDGQFMVGCSGVVLGIALILGVLVSSIVAAVYGEYVSSTCRAFGYTSGVMTWLPPGSYCITRVDQTDVVIPLGEARPRR